VDPQYVNNASGDYHLLPTSPDLDAGTGAYDEDYFDRDKISRVPSYDIGAYEIVDGSHGTGPYYVAGPGDDYRNFGTLLRPYRTLDKAMSVADNTVIIDGGHYDSFYLKLRSENININSMFVASVSSIFTISYVTLTPASIVNKYIPIPGLPLTNVYSGNSVALNLVGGSAQVFDVDYTVSTGAVLWGGLALDGFLSAGDTLRAMFPSLISTGSVVTLDSYYSNINLSNPIYVSPNGSDSSIFGGDGTHTWGNGSRQYPYRSIDRALQDASAPGTSLVVMSGEYNVFTGRDGAVVVPFSDRTGIPSGKYYLQSLFRTPKASYPNQTIIRDSDEIWNLYSSGKSEASIQNGFLTLAYDGTHGCGADSTFTFMAPFTVQADIRNAFDPMFFSVHNEDNTAVVRYFNGDWTSIITTGGHTSSCWGHLDLTSTTFAETEEFFTEYLCVSSENIANKYIPLTYLLNDSTDVALNVIGGSSQEMGADFIAEDGKIKWDGLGLEGELTAGEIMRVIYKAHGISATARFQINLLPNGILEVRGSDRSRWSKLMRRRLYSDTSSPWSSSLYMDQTATDIDHSFIFGRGYASQYFTLAAGIEGTAEAAPYLLKTWRQPIILHNSTADNT
jgi:hypothetical protein